MTTAGARRADRLRPAGWVGVAVVTAVAAGAFAGAAATLGVAAAVTATRAGADVAGVACVGLALVMLLLPPVEARTRRDQAAVRAVTDRALLVLGGAWAALVVVGIAVRAADAFGRPLPALAADEALAWSLRLAAGRGLLLTTACALAVAVGAAVRLRDPDRVAMRLLLVTALLGVLTPTVTGHAGTAADHQLAVVSSALHAGAAALWVGGLGVLIVLVARHRSLLDGALPRFSRVAGYCLLVVAVTGVVAAGVRLPGWGALLSTGYGLLIVAKAVVLVALGGLGALARRRLAAGRRPVLRWAGIEVTLMAVALGLAAALTQSAP